MSAPRSPSSAPRTYLAYNALMTRIRTRIIERGAVGIKGIGRLFRIADENDTGKIDLASELPKLMTDIGVVLNKTELNELIRLMDQNGDGEITYKEFLRQLAPPINEERLKWINKAFDKLDANGNGHVSIREVQAVHNPNSTDTVKMGKTTANEMLASLLRSYDQDGDGLITREEFIDYYREISPSVEGDESFGLMMKRAWGLD